MQKDVKKYCHIYPYQKHKNNLSAKDQFVYNALQNAISTVATESIPWMIRRSARISIFEFVSRNLFLLSVKQLFKQECAGKIFF